ncbi:condensin-2 complex subunit G2-like isoform X2 [Artemia franciscana]|uniref:condensin-2 complex subunit G2-like isoform X2 n=1 Tax=Artemia franciscana TaxID=6661 RepID=UPI0032D9DE15
MSTSLLDNDNSGSDLSQLGEPRVRKFVSRFIKSIDAKNYSEVFSKEKSVIEDAVLLFTKVQLISLWEKLHNWTEEIFSGVEGNEVELISDEQKNLLNAVVDTGFLFAEVLDLTSIPEGLVQCVTFLNSKLLCKVLTDQQLLTISSLSEKWILKGLNNFEVLLPNVIITLAHFAKRTKPQGSVLSRLWALRRLITTLDLFEAKNTNIKEALLASFESSRYLNVNDGRKFLIYMMCKDVNFGVLMHESFKLKIPYCTLEECSALGEVYFKAWKHAEEEDKPILEEKCIQFLMDHGLVASRSKIDGSRRSMADICFTILHAIHGNAKSKNELSMIRRLYAPILWRTLQAPNHIARMNATRIFCDIFPVRGDNDRETEEFIKKQYSILLGLLKDGIPAVRKEAIKGTCIVLKTHWDMVSASFLNNSMAQLAFLAFDSTSWEVRAEVIHGIGVILENPLSHEFFSKFLPDLKTVLHDINQGVREAFIDLLLSLTSLRTIKWWNISDVTNILHRLAAESSERLCIKLVKLVHPSLFPDNKSDDEMLNRAMTFVGISPSAMLKIFRYASKFVHLDTLFRVVILLVRCLRRHVKQEKKKLEETDASTAGDGESAKTDESALSHEEALVIIDIVAVAVYVNIADLYEKGSEQLIELRKHFGATAGLFLTYFKHSSSDVKILVFIYSLLGSSSRWTHMCGFAFKAIREMADSAQEADYGYLVDALCNWKRGDEILDLALEWISVAFTQNLETSVSKGRRSKKKKKEVDGGDDYNSVKKVRFGKVDNPKPLLGVRIVGHMLKNKSDKDHVLKKYKKELKSFANGFSRVLKLIEDKLCGIETSDIATNTFLREACTLLFKMSAILDMNAYEEDENNADNQGPSSKEEVTMEETQKLLNWLVIAIVPRIAVQDFTTTTTSSIPSSGSSSNFAQARRTSGLKRQSSGSDSPDFILAESILIDCLDVGSGLLLCPINKGCLDTYLMTLKSVLEIEGLPPDFVLIGFKVIQALLFIDVHKKMLEELASVIKYCLHHLFSIAAVQQDNPLHVYSEGKEALLAVISSLTRAHQITFLKEFSQEFIDLLLAVAVFFMKAKVAEDGDDEKENLSQTAQPILPASLQFKKVSELHPLLTILCQVLQQKSSFADLVFLEVESRVDRLDRAQLYATLVVLSTLEKDRGRLSLTRIESFKDILVKRGRSLAVEGDKNSEGTESIPSTV